MSTKESKSGFNFDYSEEISITFRNKEYKFSLHEISTHVNDSLVVPMMKAAEQSRVDAQMIYRNKIIAAVTWFEGKQLTVDDIVDLPSGICTRLFAAVVKFVNGSEEELKNA